LVKKLQQGDGLWSTKKEILCWVFDGVSKCLSLLTEKVDKIKTTLTKLSRKKTVWFGDLEQINRKLMHATVGIPNGWGLLSPIIALIAKKPNTQNYKERMVQLNEATKQAMVDWIDLLLTALKHPMPCVDLIPAPADYGGYIYKRGPACRFPDQGKYVFFPRYCVFATIGSNVLFWLIGIFLELCKCPHSHSRQNLFYPAYHLIVPGYSVLGIHYPEQIFNSYKRYQYE